MDEEVQVRKTLQQKTRQIFEKGLIFESIMSKFQTAY
jgi:hypothetical protein